VRKLLNPLSYIWTKIFSENNETIFKKSALKFFTTIQTEINNLKITFRINSISGLLLKLWKTYLNLYNIFISPEFSDTQNEKTWNQILEFQNLFKILPLAAPLPKLHALQELYLNIIENGPAILFETSPNESKHKEYRKYNNLTSFNLN
jgi:hypothetical protein